MNKRKVYLVCGTVLLGAILGLDSLANRSVPVAKADPSPGIPDYLMTWHVTSSGSATGTFDNGAWIAYSSGRVSGSWSGSAEIDVDGSSGPVAYGLAQSASVSYDDTTQYIYSCSTGSQTVYYHRTDQITKSGPTGTIPAGWFQVDGQPGSYYIPDPFLNLDHSAVDVVNETNTGSDCSGPVSWSHPTTSGTELAVGSPGNLLADDPDGNSFSAHVTVTGTLSMTFVEIPVVNTWDVRVVKLATATSTPTPSASPTEATTETSTATPTATLTATPTATATASAITTPPPTEATMVPTIQTATPTATTCPSITRGQYAKQLALAHGYVAGGPNCPYTICNPPPSAPTPTACPVRCDISFVDVPCSNPFAQYIYFDACNGLMSGYPDGTFRPDAIINPCATPPAASPTPTVTPPCGSAQQNGLATSAGSSSCGPSPTPPSTPHPFRITAVALLDIDNTDLQFLSVDANNPYFDGNTLVNGMITIEGPIGDALSSLTLEIIQAGAVVAVADLSPAASADLLRPFPSSGFIEFNIPSELFRLSNAQAAGVNYTTNGQLTLRVRARSVRGLETEYLYQNSVGILTRYTKNNRYGDRDAVFCAGTNPPYPCGGDDWVQPNVKPVLDYYADHDVAGLLFGDIANMNGGKFPPHQGHQDGAELDGKYPGYELRDAPAARVMIGYLNDTTFGPRIRKVIVSFQAHPCDAFCQVINDPIQGRLVRGGLASSIIKTDLKPNQPYPPLPLQHTSHFHWYIRP